MLKKSNIKSSGNQVPSGKTKLGRIFRQPEDILKKKRRLQKTTLELKENSEINLKN